MKKAWISMFAVAALGLAAQPALAENNHELGEKLFKKKCAMCHKVDKKKVGPAVVDMNTDEAVLREVVSNGRKLMPAFSKKFSAAEIDAVVAYLRSKQK